MTQHEKWLAMRSGLSTNWIDTQATTTITIYVRHVDIGTGLHMNYRCVLHNAFWLEGSVLTTRTTGNTVVNSFSVMIPNDATLAGRKFANITEWNNATATDRKENMWSADIRRRPLIVRGESLFEFVAGTDGAISTQERQLIDANPMVRRVNDVNINQYGEGLMQHIVLGMGAP